MHDTVPCPAPSARAQLEALDGADAACIRAMGTLSSVANEISALQRAVAVRDRYIVTLERKLQFVAWMVDDWEMRK